MNIHPEDMTPAPDRDDAAEALRTLRQWAATASNAEIGALDPAIGRLLTDGEYPLLSNDYPEDFVAGPDYRATLPDLQNGPASLIRGARRSIQHVGIHNFRLPIRYRTRDGGALSLESSVTGSVSLQADRKGINMSRIMRSFYAHAEKTFSFEVIEAALDDYKTDLDSLDARIQMRLSYPLRVRSLRSGLEGYQYYDIALELVETGGQRLRKNWSVAVKAVRSCISTMSIPRPAPVRWNCQSTRGGNAGNWPRRIRNARSRGSPSC